MTPLRFRCIAIIAAFIAACLALPLRSLADNPPKPIDRTGDDDFNRHLVLPSEPGDFKLKFKTHIGDQEVNLSYLLHFPADYNKDLHAKHPMLVFFHGIGERGDDLGGVLALGPMPMINNSPKFAASCPFIVLGPQCPGDVTWDTEYIYKAAAKLVVQTINHTRTDADRVYATGLSMGGLGSWCVAEEAPDVFAAIAPLSAMAWHPEQAAAKLKYIPVWAVSGVNDQPRFIDGCRAMDAALAHNPLSNRFTYFVDKGHEAWWPPFQSIGFYEWFLSHRRLTPAQKKKLDTETAPPPADVPLPTAPGHYLLSFPIMLGNQPFHMDYVLYLPKGYKPNSKPYPTMLFLAEQDTMGPVYHDLCVHGPDLELEKRPGLQSNFPFIVISPRTPIDCDWNRPGMTKALLDLLDHVSQGVAIDADRVIVTGINAGADGAWKLAAESPDRFAAIAPVVTTGPFNPPDDKANVVKTLPGRVWVKPDDAASTDRMTQLMKTTKQDWRISKMPSTASATTDVPAFADHQFLAWLQQQHRNPNAALSSAAK
jgi:predicted peptidase